MNSRSTAQRPRPSEEGYVLVAVVFMTLILVLSLAVALPRVRASIQRDREVETMERGKQYVRAVQLYYRKFNTYPPNIDALVKTNNIRFLRKKYVDPTTGKEEWKPVMFGQNKTPQAMGFFGQPLAAALGGGIGPSGGNGLQGGIAGPAAGATPSSGGGFLSTGSTTGSTDTGAGATGTGATGIGTPGGTDSNGNPTAGGPAGGQPGIGSPGSSPGTSPTSGQTFGGAGIIGFSPQSPKLSILTYKKKNHYNEWEFLYSPLSDQQSIRGGNTGTVGQPAGSTTTPVGNMPAAPATPTTPGTTPQ